jgi:hypothetical protein
MAQGQGPRASRAEQSKSRAEPIHYFLKSLLLVAFFLFSLGEFGGGRR